MTSKYLIKIKENGYTIGFGFIISTMMIGYGLFFTMLELSK